jgi:beta-glucosidase
MQRYRYAIEPKRPTSQSFMFATGIECSYPIITGKDGQSKRMDQMEITGHYKRWKEDFQLVKEFGLDFLRYGPPYYNVHIGPGRYDWSFVDETFGELRRLNIVPIADLCHFGVPDWIGDFQNSDWPKLFAEYARAFAERYPWVRFFTPMNEIYIAATFSAEFGWWNERKKSDAAFVNALKNLVRANLLAEEAISEVIPKALFIQSESSEYFHARLPKAQARANFLNQKRFLSLDLSYGHDVPGLIYEYLLDHGMTSDEYHWFMMNGAAIKPNCIMGTDYYLTNEHLVLGEDGEKEPAGEIFGYYVLARQYYERYHLPVMHTETNIKDDGKATTWLWKEWSNMLRLKQDGVPIIGFTWYSLIDQIDWDTALIGLNNRVNPVGLYDMDRKIREVGREYRELVSEWRGILPLENMCLEAVMGECPGGDESDGDGRVEGEADDEWRPVAPTMERNE